MLAIAGGKGGCGKTTTTLGLATALSRTAASPTDGELPPSVAPPLAVDADWDMPNLHALAGVDREPTLEDAESGEATPHVADGFQLLPAPHDPPRGHDAAVSLLDSVRSIADEEQPVLVDCPAGAGPDAAAPLRAADEALLVSEPTPESLRDAAKTGAMAQQLDAPICGVVLTRINDELPAGSRDAIESLLGSPVVGAVPEAPPPALDRTVVRREYTRAVRRLSDTNRSAAPLSGI